MEKTCGNENETDALDAGSILDDRYVISKVIGSGGFGITYLAYDTVLEKSVAVKEFYPKGLVVRGIDNITIEPITSFHAEEFRNGAERFRNEAEILSGLGDNTDVIKVYDCFGQNGTIYYVMEYVHGITINEYTKRYGKISEGQALFAAGNITDTFGHIHSRNIIHRDLSPNNVMLTVDGRVMLVDFGNARPFFNEVENSMTVALKPGYAPLEQYQHHGNHGPWTDIYSLGTVLYYALTLESPRDPMTRLEDDSDFQNGLAKINSLLAAVINKMAAVRIRDRYSGWEELLSDLKQVKIDPEKFYVHISENTNS
ncbi:MAG: serine/threonine protein kinase [Oscillospiraceae bacterium]|nr:serine/threonine protein kinase [Oscillospiraceae bacterium]